MSGNRIREKEGRGEHPDQECEDGTTIYIRDIMGAEIAVEGAISMVDLANSIVKINCIEE